MTDERMAVTIGLADQELKNGFNLDTLNPPNEPNEIGTSVDGLEYIVGARALYANSVNVSYSMNEEVNRLAGEIDKDQMYKQTDPLTCNIDIEYYISNNHFSGYGDPYLFMRDDIPGGNRTGYAFYPITVGRNVYNKCYLDSLDINIKPFAPVTCRARFRSTAPPSGEKLDVVYTAQKDETSPNYLMNSDNFVFGFTCELSGWLKKLVNIDAVTEINFSRTYGRKDIYCLGEETPRESLVKDVENRMIVRSTGLKYLISSNGQRVEDDIYVIWRDSSGVRPETTPVVGFSGYPVDLTMKMSSGCYVTAQNYSIRGGDLLQTDLTISEAIL